MTDPIVYEVKVYAGGYKEWYFEGKRHRVDGPAVEYAGGYKEWYFEGKRHRVDGPAVEYADGYKVWWFNGKRHRVDGPALEDASGDKAWYLEGKRVSEPEHARLTADHSPNQDILNRIRAAEAELEAAKKMLEDCR